MIHRRGGSTLDPDPVDVEQLAWRLVSSAEGDAEAPPLPDPPLHESGVFGLPLTESASFFNVTPPPNLEERDRRWRIPHRIGARFDAGFSAATVPACFSRKRSSTTIWSSVIAAATHSSLTVVILADADATLFIESKGIRYAARERERERREVTEERERGEVEISKQRRKREMDGVIYEAHYIIHLFFFFSKHKIVFFLHLSKCTKMQIWI